MYEAQGKPVTYNNSGELLVVSSIGKHTGQHTENARGNKKKGEAPIPHNKTHPEVTNTQLLLHYRQQS